MSAFNENNPSPARKIIEIIPYVMRVMASEIRQNSSNLRPAHFQLLGKLIHRSWTLSELADSQAVSAPTMSKTITLLEERGWVTRIRSEADRRVVLIEATEEGHRIIKEALTRAENHITSLLESLDSDEQKKLAEGLDILRQMFEKESPAYDPLTSIKHNPE